MKIVHIITSILLIFNILKGQTSATATWALTANQTSSVSGNITGYDQSLGNMQVTYSSGVQRSSPAGTAGSWPSETTENATRYMQFKIKVNPGYLLNVSGISAKLYVNSGSGMKANVYYSLDSSFVIRTQINSTYTLSSTAPSTPNITATPNVTVNSGEYFYIRIYPWYTSATTGKYTIANTVQLSGTTSTTNAIITSVNSLTDFLQTSSSPSDTKSYTVSGTNLSANVIITPPLNYEISTNAGSSWNNSSSPVTLNVNSGIITGQPISILVRLNSSVPGYYAEELFHSSSGTPTKLIDLTGTRLASEPTIQSTITFLNISGNSMTVNFKGGNGSSRILVARAGNAVNWTPTDGFQVTGVNSDFSLSSDKGNGNKVLYDGIDTTCQITGLVPNTNYYFAIYEYNSGIGNSQNYLTINPGTGNQTTPAVPSFNSSTSSILFGTGIVQQDTIKKNFTLSASYLNPLGGIVTLTCTSGFQISFSQNTGYSNSITYNYTNGTISGITVYVSFIPQVVQNYSGQIAVSGGGATEFNISLFGSGVNENTGIQNPVGFASLDGGTTGGNGGTVQIITDPNTLVEIMRLRENRSTAPLILYIQGKLTGLSTMISVKRTANVSIIGIGADAEFSGFGMKIVECSNVIVRNLKFSDCKVDEKDALNIDGSHNVWIDHCTFTDSPGYDPSGSSHDGLLDVKNGSYNISLSYNLLQNHRKTALLGHTPNQISDTALKVTYYNNWWDGTYSRNPRIRFAKAHLFNNYYRQTTGYGVGITCSCHVFVESNYYDSVSIPVLISLVNDPGGTLSGDPVGFVKASNNYLTGSGNLIENLSGYDFNPNNYYSYTVRDAQSVKSYVMANAGAGKLSFGNFLLNLVVFPEGLYNSGNLKSDSIKVFLANNYSPYAIVDSATGYLDSTGLVILNFTKAINNYGYYYVVKHRNSLETWSSSNNMFLGNASAYNFSDNVNKAYGNNLVQKGSKWCIYSGDINQDGVVNSSDMITINSDLKDFKTGYILTDLNNDGIVDMKDIIIADNNYKQSVSIKKP